MMSFLRRVTRWLFPWIVGVLVASVVAWPYWQERFPYTHDGENHLIRFANYAAAVREGQWPPRFAPYVYGGFGFPVFNYNYPLANIAAVPFVRLGMNPERVFALFTTIALGIGATAVFKLLRTWGKGAALLGSLTYLTTSFVLLLLFIRGNIGELVAYGLIPLWLLVWRELLQKPSPRRWLWMVIVSTCLLLSHNLYGLFGGAMLGLMSLIQEWKQRKTLGLSLSTWAIAIGNTAWFWWPAVGELGYVVLQQDSLAQEATTHLLTVSQALWEPVQFGFSRLVPIDDLGMGVGLFAIGVWVSAVLLWVRRRLQPRWLGLLIGGALAFVFLSTSLSEGVWNVIPQLSIWQFPWRLLFFAALLLPFLAAWTWQQSGWWGRAFLLVLFIVYLNPLRSLRPADFFHNESSAYLMSAHTSLTRNENRPKTLTGAVQQAWEPRPQIATGSGEIVRIEEWLGSHRRYVVKAETDVVVQEPTVAFPGWFARDETGRQYFPHHDEKTQGLLSYQLPARAEPYILTSAFHEQTPIRLIADSVSLLAVALTCIVGSGRVRRLGKMQLWNS